MNYFISYYNLISFGINEDYLKVALIRYRKGKSKSWVNKKDRNDKRKVLIDIDSIPKPTRIKHNIPTGKEYFERMRIEKYQETQKAEKQKIEQRFEAEKAVLYNAYRNEYLPFIELYQERYSHSNNNYKVAVLSAQCHAFWLKMLEVTGNETKTYHGGCRRGFELYLELKKELIFTKDFTNENYFRILLSKMRASLLKNGCIIDLVANGKRKPATIKKTNKFHRGIAMAFLSHPNKYSYRIVADLVNYHCIEEQEAEITESWIKQLMANDNHFRTLVMAYRNGEKYTKENILAHAVRKNTPFPANVWMIDGTPLQFYCWNEERTKQVRLNLFVIIDVCSRKIVGFDISYSETRYNIMNALKMAVMEEGHLPSEIVSDNFSASKTEEIKSMVDQMANIGTLWRHSKVGNPQDKSYVERFFGSFQSVECTLYDDYIGEGIMSKRDNRRTADQLLKTAKKDGMPTFKQMKDRVITMIITYNQREKANQKAPKNVYKSLPKPNAIELDSVRTALLFWKRTKATIKKSMVKIVVDKVEHFYEVKDHKISTELQGKRVFVRYDENDLQRIMLFDIEHEQVIGECKKSLKIATAEVDRTPEDLENMYKVTSKNKSKLKYIKDQKAEILEPVFKKVGKESIDLIHPRGLSKNKLTEFEDLEQQERLRLVLNITKENEEKPVKEPLETIYKTVSKIDYEDFVVQKKPLKQGSLKIVQTTNKDN